VTDAQVDAMTGDEVVALAERIAAAEAETEAGGVPKPEEKRSAG
jgi:hypothetical protein